MKKIDILSNMKTFRTTFLVLGLNLPSFLSRQMANPLSFLMFCCFLLLGTDNIFAQENVTIGTTSSSQGVTSSLSFSHTVSSGSNRLLMVAIGTGSTGTSNSDAPTVSGVTYSGTPLTFIGTQTETGTRVRIYLYSMVNPPVGTANVVVTTSASAPVFAGATNFLGVNQSTPYGSFFSNSVGTAVGVQGGATSITLSGINSATDEIIFDVVGVDSDGALLTITPGAGQTQRWNLANGSGLSSAGGSTKTGSASASTSWSWSGNQQAAIGAVSIKPVQSLPVELVSFNAKVRNNIVHLNWKTATEVNNYGFEIEKCQTSNVKSETWEKVGFVNGHGNSNSPKEYFFEDQKLSNASYQYRLKQIDTDGSFSYSKIVNVTVDLTPNSFALMQNYPNPFNPTTVIRYTVAEESFVTIKIYNIIGSEIMTVVNEKLGAGSYEFNFNASELSSGAYIYKIIAGNFSDTKKMILSK